MPHRQTAFVALIAATALLAPACRRTNLAPLRARAEQGNPDAQYRLASAYYYGRGLPKDYAQAFRWYQKAADQGEATAQYAVGFCYHYGRGVPRNPAQAALWERRAADQGNVLAQCQLASLYETGDGVPQDLAESARWYRRCADQGSATGQRNLGFAYARGDTGPRDYAEAARWFRKAAGQGDRLSQAYLAYAYRTGVGVPRDRVQAAGWYLRVGVSCARRVGWTPTLVCLAGLGGLILPDRAWGRRRWLAWAISAIGCSVYAVHLLSAHPWTGWWNQLETAFFVVLAAVSASAAVYEALQNRRSAGAPPVA